MEQEPCISQIKLCLLLTSWELRGPICDMKRSAAAQPRIPNRRGVCLRMEDPFNGRTLRPVDPNTMAFYRHVCVNYRLRGEEGAASCRQAPAVKPPSDKPPFPLRPSVSLVEAWPGGRIPLSQCSVEALTRWISQPFLRCCSYSIESCYSNAEF